NLINPPPSTPPFDTHTYQTHFRPDNPVAFNDVILVAFGTDQAPHDATLTVGDLAAGNDINLRHTAARPVVSFTPTTNRDTPLGDLDTGAPLSVTDHVGEIDLFTNGFIVDTEARGDLRVGTITSTSGDVTLTAADAGASIFDVHDSIAGVALLPYV